MILVFFGATFDDTVGMPSPSESPAIASSVLHSLYNELADHRVLFERGFRRFNISMQQLQDFHGQVSLRSFVQIFEWLAAEIGDPALGLQVSQRAGPAALGAVGYLFLSSGNLENALQALTRYITAVQSCSDMAVDYVDDYAQVRYQITDDSIVPRRQDAEYSIGLIWHYMKLLSRNKCRLVQVGFEHDEINGVSRQHRKLFGAPVLYGQNTNSMTIHLNEFRQWHEGYDPYLIPILEEHIANTMRDDIPHASFTQQVEQQLTESVLRQGARAEIIAGMLKISPVTLHHRLRREGTRFKQLVDNRSKAIANRLLRHSSMPIAIISSRLGYADPASFTRACRRWFGQNPRDVRASARAGGVRPVTLD